MFTTKIPRLRMIQIKRPPRLVHRRLCDAFIKHQLWQLQNRLVSPGSVIPLFGHTAPLVTHHYVTINRSAEQIQNQIDPELMHETWCLAAPHQHQDMQEFIHQQYLKQPCIDGDFYERRQISLQLRELIREPFPELASSEISDLYADPKAWRDQTRHFMKELMRLGKASERMMEHVLQEDLGL